MIGNGIHICNTHGLDREQRPDAADTQAVRNGFLPRGYGDNSPLLSASQSPYGRCACPCAVVAGTDPNDVSMRWSPASAGLAEQTTRRAGVGLWSVILCQKRCGSMEAGWILLTRTWPPFATWRSETCHLSQQHLIFLNSYHGACSYVVATSTAHVR